MYNKAEEAGDIPKSYSVIFTAEEERALNELHVSSYNIDLHEADDLDWEESSPEPAAAAAIDQACEQQLF